MVVVVELEPAGAEPTVPGSVVVVLDEQEKQPVAVLSAKTTSIEQPKRAIIRCAILVDFIPACLMTQRMWEQCYAWAMPRVSIRY